MKLFINKNDKNKGFTLAEVLITLLIIGVVASIILPNLINDTKDAELNTALKKVYGELSVATKHIIYDNGGTFIGVLSSDNDHSGLRNAYAEHLSYTKSCTTSRTEGCWHPLSTDGGTWKQLNGNGTDGNSVGTGLILNNGVFINFLSQKKDCSYTGPYYSNPAICAMIIIDVNGFKLPNTIGKDVFYFNILADRIEPWGAPNSIYHTCSPTISGGIYCAAPKLMQ